MDEAALQAIAAEGASVIVVDSDYDQALHRAAEYAKDRGEAELVQDTSWQGYEQIPQWIVDGYSTLFAEIDIQVADVDKSGPNAVFVPVGAAHSPSCRDAPS